MKKKAKILVADDTRLQRMLLHKMLVSEQIDVVLACDGKEAVEIFIQEKPDLCILDVLMPNMDGVEAAKQIQSSLSENEHVPIVFITAQDNEKNLQRCVEAKADDFIAKPFNPTILHAKLNSLLRFKCLYEEQSLQKKQLLTYQQIAEQEQDVASAIHEKIIHSRFLDVPNIKHFLSPMSLFNGDIFLVAKTPGNQLYCLLGDFTGHGLSASVGASPAADIFYGMVNKGFGGSEILQEINKKLHCLLPVQMFLAATLVTLDPESRFINVIACGLPDHYLLNKVTGQVQIIKSQNVPLGIVDNFEIQERSLSVTSNDHLYLFTDGIIEAESIDGKQFGFDGIESCLVAKEQSVFENILQGQQLHCQGLEQQDDITLIEIHCDLETAPWKNLGQTNQHKEVIPLIWKNSMEFEVKTLQHVSPVPVMLNSIMEIQGLFKFKEAIFIIVSELFNNCLDHGLLGLDSKLKNSAEGFSKYYELKAQRLNQREGYIKVLFSHRPFENGGQLIIRMKDSGEGFDHRTLTANFSDNQNYHGRGMALVNTLCKELQYSDGGTRVKAVFEWENEVAN